MNISRLIVAVSVVLSSVVAMSAPTGKGGGNKGVEKSRESGVRDDSSGKRETGVEVTASAKDALTTAAKTEEVLGSISLGLDKTQRAQMMTLLSQTKLSGVLGALASAKKADLQSEKIDAKDMLSKLDTSVTELLLAVSNAKSSQELASSKELVSFLETHATQIVGEIANGNVGYLEAGKFNRFIDSIKQKAQAANCANGCDTAFNDAAVEVFGKAYKDSTFDKLCK